MIRVLLVDDQELVRAGFRIIIDSEPGMEVVGEAATGAEAVELAAELAPDVICMDIEMPQMNGIEASRLILGGVGGTRETAILILTTFGHEEYLFDALAAGVSGFLLKTARAEQLIDAVRTLAAGDALLGPDVTRAVIARVASGRRTAGTGESSSGEGAVGPEAVRRAGVEAPTAGVDPQGNAGLGGGAEPRDARSSPGEDRGAPSGGAAGHGRASAAAAAAVAAVGLSERETEVLVLAAEGKSNGEIAGQLFLGEATVKTHMSNLLRKLGARDRVQAVVWAHTRGLIG
jgi:DNA-binding NarL/FixJ family response regulator